MYRRIVIFSKLPRACHPWVQKRREEREVNKAVTFAISHVASYERREKERLEKKAYRNKGKGEVTQLLTYKKSDDFISETDNIYPTTKNLFRKK